MSDSIRDRLLKEAGDSPEPIEIKVTRAEFADLRTEMLEHGIKWQTYRFPMANRIELIDSGKLRVIVLINYGD